MIVTLQGLTVEQTDMIASETEGKLFEWERPVALVREKPAEEANVPPAEAKTEEKTAELPLP